MEIIYRAFDGEEYKNRAECESHENQITKSSIRAIDWNGKPLGYEDINFSYQVWMVCASTKNALDHLRMRLRKESQSNENMVLPNEIYVRQNKQHDWYSARDTLNYYEDELSRLQKGYDILDLGGK